MKANMGSADRIIRLIVAALLVVAALMGWVSGVLAVVALVLAAVFVLTSVVSVCPLYLPFGLKTTPKSE